MITMSHIDTQEQYATVGSIGNEIMTNIPIPDEFNQYRPNLIRPYLLNQHRSHDDLFIHQHRHYRRV